MVGGDVVTVEWKVPHAECRIVAHFPSWVTLDRASFQSSCTCVCATQPALTEFHWQQTASFYFGLQ